MKQSISAYLSLSGLALLLAACAPTSKQMVVLFEEHPEILVKAIEKNPDKIMDALQAASMNARAKAQENAAKEAENQFENEFKTPLEPLIDPKRPVMGNKSAPILIVEYTDFQCPFCARGYETLEQVRKTYGDKVRVLVKNLPLPMHPMAMPAALMFEALVQKNPVQAFKFYHEVFRNQEKLNEEGEKFLDRAAKKVGANLASVKKEMKSEAVRKAVAEDMAEAEKFGISGTPGFIINGVSVRGAYPLPHFKQIIDRHLSKK